MKPEQKNLEKRAEKECPFVETKTSLHYGIYLLVGDDETSYECSIDGGIARGGNLRTSISGGVSTPCTMKYAKTCPLYIEHVKG